MVALRRALTIAAALVLTASWGGVSLAAVSVPWATQAGGAASDYGYAISTLSDGSAIVTGEFQGTATFGSTTLTSAGGSDDIFVAKIDASGTYLWATQAGGTSSDIGYGVSALADGSAIVTGSFSGIATFGSTTLTSAGITDVFVAKIDASGTFLWATQAGGTSGDVGDAVSTLSDGSAIVTGRFSGNATFGSTTFTGAGRNNDVFVAKIDASGTFLWATQAGGTSSDVGDAVSTLSDGSAIVTGHFQDTATFGSTTLTTAGGFDVFVAKIDASGTYLWATQAGGTALEFGKGVSALADGSAIVTGLFNGTATFGSTTLTSAGERDVFVAKIDASGTYVWATKAGGTAADLGLGISTLSDGSAVVTGYFTGTATFGSTTLTSAGGSDVFVAKINASGTYLWATQAGGGATDVGYGVSTISDGSAIVTGYFQGTATFGSTTFTSAGGSDDVFVAEIDSAPSAPTSVVATAGDGRATISWSAPESDGGSAITSYTATTSPGGATCTATAPATTCTVTGLTNGTPYTFAVTATNAAGTSPASVSSAAVTPAAPTPAPAPAAAAPCQNTFYQQAARTWKTTRAPGGASALRVVSRIRIYEDAQAACRTDLTFIFRDARTKKRLNWLPGSTLGFRTLKSKDFSAPVISWPTAKEMRFRGGDTTGSDRRNARLVLVSYLKRVKGMPAQKDVELLIVRRIPTDADQPQSDANPLFAQRNAFGTGVSWAAVS